MIILSTPEPGKPHKQYEKCRCGFKIIYYVLDNGIPWIKHIKTCPKCGSNVEIYY